MIPKSGNRFSDKIMLRHKVGLAAWARLASTWWRS